MFTKLWIVSTAMTARSTEWARAHPERHRERTKAWQRANPGKTAISLRRSRLKAKYGLTEEDYARMLETQNDRCAICGKPQIDSKDGRFHVDHDHKTGRVRGLLCDRCNVGLGSFEDNPQRLVLAARYLNDFA